MPSSALALVLAAALLHAGWNLWMKRAGAVGGPAFVWGTAVVATIVFAPIAWLAGAFDPVGAVLASPACAPTAPAGCAAAVPGDRAPALASFAAWPAGVWLASAISAVIHTAYFHVLQRGYAAGDLSIVYPVARGTGPLLAAIVAIAWLGEPAGPFSFVGLLLVAGGTFTIAGGASVLRRGGSPLVRRSLAWGLATGVLIGAYTVNDGRAVARLGAHPLVYYWSICAAQAMLLAPWAMRTVPAWRALLARAWPVVLGVGVLSPLSYLLALEAMRLAPVSVVAPARELSMLIAALAGAVLLREGQLVRRLAGSALIASGVALLAIAL